MRKLMKIFSIALCFVFLMAYESQAEGDSKQGSFGAGVFGGFHRYKQVTGVNLINVGGRFRMVPVSALDVFFDFSYYLKKAGTTFMQPKVGANYLIPVGGKLTPFLGPNVSFNLVSASGSPSQKKIGFGGQLGTYISVASKLALFVEGQFEMWLLSTKKATVFGGIGGLMLYF